MTAPGRWRVRHDPTLRGPQWVVTDPDGRDVAVAHTHAAAAREATRRARAAAADRRAT